MRRQNLLQHLPLTWRPLLLGVLLLLATLPTSITASPRLEPPAKPLAALPIDQLPLRFESNQGQADPAARFVAHTLAGSLAFTPDAVTLALAAPRPERHPPLSVRKLDRHLLRLRFVAANSAVRLQGQARQAGRVNYLLGNDPSRWQTDIPTYGALTYQQIYPGIDLHYAGDSRQLKGTYTVRAGADPTQIRWRYAGAQRVRLDQKSGDLLITLPQQGGTLTEAAPVAWQEINNQRVPVAVGYHLSAQGDISFGVGQYNRAFALIIDPTLSYSTYLGGNSADYGYDIAVDAQGNIYVTGATGSTNFPLSNPIQSTPSPFGDLFVTKFNANGTLAYSTYLGGNDSDVGFGIAVDGAGNAYVTGESWSNNFPLVNPIPPNNPGIQQDVIVLKLNSTGNALVYSTYLGGFNSQTGWDIAVDSAGSAYITGHTLSPNFPLVNPIQATANVIQDAFVLKLNASGSALVYSTYLGSNSSIDYGFGIAVDSAGNAYVTGQAPGTGFPTVNALQPTNAGFGDAFVSKINAAGTALVYSTYLGGGLNDTGESITVDNAGNAYVAGWTNSTNFPTLNPLQATNRGYEDLFVTKFNSTGSALVYSTYLGGSLPDGNYDVNVAVDGNGNAYVAGNSQSTDFPVINAVQYNFGGGSSDAVVAKLDAQGATLLYSTYLGGSNLQAGLGDYAYGLAVDGSGNAYITGYTFAANFPLAGTPLQMTNSGNYDAFVARINDLPLTLPTPTPTPLPTPTPTPNPALVDFVLNVSPTSQTVARGGATYYGIDVTAVNGFSGNVQLSVSGLPARTSGTFVLNPVTLTGSNRVFSRLDITTQRNASSGTYPLVITGTGGGKTRSQTVTLVISRQRATNVNSAGVAEVSETEDEETSGTTIYLPVVTK